MQEVPLIIMINDKLAVNGHDKLHAAHPPAPGDTTSFLIIKSIY